MKRCLRAFVGGALFLFCFLCQSALATQLTNIRLGNPSAPAGSTSYNASKNTYTVSGEGWLAYASTNYFGDFAYTSINGNFTVSTEITNYSGDGWSGIMALNSLNSQDIFVGSLLSMANPFGPGYAYTTSYDGAVNSSSPPVTTASTYWLRLSRVGNLFTEYSSANGSSWNLSASETLAMGNTVYAGLFVNSASAGPTDTATFSNISGLPISATGPNTFTLLGLMLFALFVFPKKRINQLS